MVVMKTSKVFLFLFTATMILAMPAFANAKTFKPDHPYYLRALSDLRAARWMINHRPGNLQKTVDEEEAVRQIDKAIFEIKKASIDDGKDVNDHPKVDERRDHVGRLRVAVDFLNKALDDVNKDEDNRFAEGLQGRSMMHIKEAIRLTEKAIRQ
jgi:hypothetical protein